MAKYVETKSGLVVGPLPKARFCVYLKSAFNEVCTYGLYNELMYEGDVEAVVTAAAMEPLSLDFSINWQ